MEYLMIKWLHIVSSTILVGTGLGSAFYFFFTMRHGTLAEFAFVARWVVRADWWLTTPTVILQPLTGVLLIQLGNWPVESYWLVTSISLYILAGLCWLPVVFLQIRMRDLASLYLSQRTQNETQLKTVNLRNDFRLWVMLGIPAFSAMLLIYALMIFKPL